ncbi:hypothetical protein F2Y20_22840 [Bacteroides caccae]|uniref:Uncharacterized protein n=1 Tax=Bacteroides caccae TaxID=47678 RepID=A0A9P4A2Z3_9BACE|nr:hypothetical protein F2Y20_22840 [Bacteroides caccae]KAA3167695.1 hypothetical protein F2A07_14410 [Akkermansia sp. BIOML-A61]KAA2337834.1 hypothetical protein F2Y23_01735 [Bacteroides caccae]KAA5491388.1 hypothetical protein F2Y31_22930 [Bacteroides caccae]KAA5504598.1 hypothetical protein F2Y26_10815 [Bacteroides caccae]
MFVFYGRFHIPCLIRLLLVTVFANLIVFFQLLLIILCQWFLFQCFSPNVRNHTQLSYFKDLLATAQNIGSG